MKVSIVIPAFNRAAMLRQAIASVISEDYPEKEIIVVDDGSTDETSQVVREFGSDVKYHYIENGGVSKARNVGISMSSGEWIAFLDSDDLWLPGKLSCQMRYLAANPHIHICQTEEEWQRNGVKVNPKNIHKKYSGWIFEECIPLCIVSPSAVIIKRTVFDDVGFFDEKMPACEDYDLWLRIAQKYQIITLPEKLIIKRGGHEGQLSNQRGLDIWRIYSLEKILAEGIDSAEFASKIRKDIVRRALIVSAGAAKRGNKKLQEKYQAIAKKHF